MPTRQSRLRVGLLLPSSNTSQEPELTRILPDGVTLHAARLPSRPDDPSSAAKILEDIEFESQKLADADVDAIVFAAAAPSSSHGIGYDQELIKRIEAASGRKATTASTALIQALAALGVKRLVIGAPWSEEVTVTSAAFIAASGFTVLGHRALGYTDNLDIGRLDEQAAYDMGLAVDQPDAEAVILAGGTWLTMGIVDRLESVIGKPVVSTNQVSLWAALRLAGYRAPVFGCGRLLREFMA